MCFFPAIALFLLYGSPVYCMVVVIKSCLTLYDLMDRCLPGCLVHGISQARILEWVAISFSGDLPDWGIEPEPPTLQADSLTTEPPGKPILLYALVAKLCQILATPWTSPPGSSVHGILQARILEWVAISFSSRCY